jgi:hypothetical protein
VTCLPNFFFTWGFTHDWCVTHHYHTVRISGEDHYSAYKPPYMAERCTRLSPEWTLKSNIQCFAHDIKVSRLATAIRSFFLETPDMVPLVGLLHDTSRICYLVGCNAWGQSILSYAASLVPGTFGLYQSDGTTK